MSSSMKDGGNIVPIDDLLIGLGLVKDFEVHQVACGSLSEGLVDVGHLRLSCGDGRWGDVGNELEEGKVGDNGE